jgi:hypothetical protein
MNKTTVIVTLIVCAAVLLADWATKEMHGGGWPWTTWRDWRRKYQPIYIRREGEIIRNGIGLQWWHGPRVHFRAGRFRAVLGWHRRLKLEARARWRGKAAYQWDQADRAGLWTECPADDGWQVGGWWFSKTENP